MSKKKETVPEVIDRLSQEIKLERDQIKSYADALAAAWQRERKALNMRFYRLCDKLGSTTLPTTTTTKATTEPTTTTTEATTTTTKATTEPTTTTTKATTTDKEERNEKETFPPTPPYREKAKKEETLTLRASVARARTCVRLDVPSLDTVLSAAPLTGVDEAYARWWYAEMSARDWTNTNGSRIDNSNWRAVIRAWFVRNNPSEREAALKAAAEARRAEMSGRIFNEPFGNDLWILCAERCAHCEGKRCARGLKLPPNLLNPPRPPEECPSFSRILPGKEVAR